MLGNVQPTEFDLRFSIFGIPVRVHPMFWLVAAFIVWRAAQAQISLILIGIGCVFFSILVHELGHAVVMQVFGSPARIVLYYLGGLASFEPTRHLSPQRSILIALAGPCAGFGLYGVVWGIEYYLEQIQSPLLLRHGIFFAIAILKWANLYWGLLNLLPVYPLDGGQVTRTLLMWLWPSRGLLTSLQLSLVTAGSVAAYFLLQNAFFIGILMASMAALSYQHIQAYGNRGW